MRLTTRWIFMLTLPPLMWAGNAVVGRLLVGAVPPLMFNALRWGLALLILLPLGWRVFQSWKDIGARWQYLTALGLLGMGSYNALLYGSLQTSTPLNVTLIAASTPVFMLLMGSFFYGVKSRSAEVLGAVLSLLGVAVVLSRGSWTTLLSVRFVVGDVLMLLAVVVWSAYTWLLARPPAHMQGKARPAWGWAEFLLIQVSIGCVWSFSAAGLEWQFTHQAVVWGPALWLGCVYVAIGPSVLAYWCWGQGVAAMGPAVAAFFANLTPVFAALLSAALLGEWPHAYHLLAFALILLGIVLSANKPRQKVPG
jgi:drug/metabolite transporter (DMT)-like permease